MLFVNFRTLPMTCEGNTARCSSVGSRLLHGRRRNDWFGDALIKARNPQRELFAQAFTLFHYNPEAMRATLPETYEFFQTFTERSEGRPAAAGRADLAARPVAEKKTALLEAAKANDPALLKELSTTSDAASLQRATVELIRSAPDSKALDAANTRMSELVQDPDTEPDEEELPSS